MSNVPSELRYTKTHEWAKLEDDGSVLIGITEHAQSLLGDMVYVELPELIEVTMDEECAVVESVKAASDVYSPINGEIIEVNDALRQDPALINSDPYGAGWLFRIKPLDEEELREMLDADQYQQHVASEEH